jgi:hypothetical protein
MTTTQALKLETPAESTLIRVPLHLEGLFGIVTDPAKKSRLLPVLNNLIMNQAGLHMRDYNGNPQLLEAAIRRKGNTLKGFIVFTNNQTPVAYAVYYPAIDNNGQRKLYVEDGYVAESYRRYGIMSMVFNRLARSAQNENASYLEWTTDGRNAAFMKFAEKIGAIKPNILSLDGDNLLNEKLDVEFSSAYARPIVARDISYIEQLGLPASLIRENGDINFKGFICFADEQEQVPLAVVPGWEHLSTFRLEQGIHLEHPTFQKDIDPIGKEGALRAIIKALQDYREENKESVSYIRWHVDGDDTAFITSLQNNHGLTHDKMLDDVSSSIMHVYRLSNGNMKAMAELGIPNHIDISRTGGSIGPSVAPRK